MSIPAGHIRCHGCNFKGFVQRRSITLRYEISETQSVDSHRVQGWCQQCNNIRDIEAPLQSTALKKQIDELKSRHRAWRGFFARTFGRALNKKAEESRSELDRLEKLIQIAQNRRSAARCLTCGESSVSELKFDDTDNSSNLVHTCGSHLYLVPEDPDAPRFSYRPEVIVLSTEGQRK